MAIERILIVDDEETLCEVLKLNLENEGYDVDIAFSAEQALMLDLKSYSLILLDIMMGEISGIKMAKMLKANVTTADIPIIFCTARDSEDDMVMGLNLAEVARLSSDDICWKENMVIIRPQTSKTGGGRMVPLRGCYQIPNELRVIPQNWQRRWRSLRKQAGFMHWTPDVCRHTFATYHAAHFRNLPALQLEMGHGNLNLLRSRYMRPASANVARCFWALSQLPHEYQRISSRNMCVYPEK